jgi:hypothetical protein
VRSYYSEPVELDFSQWHGIEVNTEALYAVPDPTNLPPRNTPFKLWLDQRLVWEATLPFYPCTPASVAVGQNPIGSNLCQPRFSGTILGVNYPARCITGWAPADGFTMIPLPAMRRNPQLQARGSMKSIVRAVSPRQLSTLLVVDHHLYRYLLVVYRDQTIPALLVVASALPLSVYEAKTSIVGFPASRA